MRTPSLVLAGLLLSGALVSTAGPASADGASSAPTPGPVGSGIAKKCPADSTTVAVEPLVAGSGRTVGRARLAVSADGTTYCGEVRVAPRYHREGTRLRVELEVVSSDRSTGFGIATPDGRNGHAPALLLDLTDDPDRDSFGPGSVVRYDVALLRWSRPIADVAVRTRVPAA